ncbi:MAG TPA: TlpA disulfide reductase family protein [Wenzhouxiangellaceae bacterium]|nr:TlpA disulfide reductase family protein [Wenzhouxiangellaceae bacterium]
MKSAMYRLTLVLALLAAASVNAQEYPEAPSFSLETDTGAALDLPANQQGIGVYLFWASWCPYCRALMPHLQSIKDEFGDRVTVYALNFRDQQDPSAYLKEHGFDFVLLPEAGEVAESWGVKGTPGLFIVDRQRQIRFNLYDVLATNPPGFEDLNHTQRAQRRAPFWAARIRQSLDTLMSDPATAD